MAKTQSYPHGHIFNLGPAGAGASPLLERVRELTLDRTDLDDSPDYYTVALSLGIPAAVAEKMDETLTARLFRANHREVV